VTEHLYPGSTSVEPQSLGDQVMGVMQVMLVPAQKVFLRFPVGEKPEFTRIFGGTENVEAHETGSVLDEMRTVEEGAADLGFHSIGDGETA